VGRYFEDYAEGEVTNTGGRTVTDADLVLFAGISGNANPLHMDEEYARSLGLQGRLVHGLCTLSILSGLIDRLGYMEGTILAHMGIDSVKFLKPVYVGDTLHATVTVIKKRALDDGTRGIIKTETVGINQRGEKVVKSVDAILVKCRKGEGG
jgi:acyl dehydratase